MSKPITARPTEPTARSGEDALRAALDRPPKIQESASGRYAAVAAIFDRRLDLLLIRRAERAGDPWSGHVSLPGGRVEERDPDTLATAIRETAEEVGLPLSPADALGALDDVATPRGIPQLVVRPWVFLVPDLEPLTPNHEVAGLHRISLAALLAGEGRGAFEYVMLDHRYTLARVDFAGQRLWGMTLSVVDDLLHRLDGRGVGLDRLPGGGQPRER